MLGKKKNEAEAYQCREEADQVYIRNAVFGKNPLAAQEAGDQAQAALSDYQAIVNPKNKSKRPKRK